MATNYYIKTIFLLLIIGMAVAAENYIDYEDIKLADEMPERSPAENIHELYRLLMQRRALENAGFGETPLEHLMIRKSQRSPSLRLRFGRADPHLSIGLLPRPINDVASSRFDN